MDGATSVRLSALEAIRVVFQGGSTRLHFHPLDHLTYVSHLSLDDDVV